MDPDDCEIRLSPWAAFRQVDKVTEVLAGEGAICTRIVVFERTACTCAIYWGSMIESHKRKTTEPETFAELDCPVQRAVNKTPTCEVCLSQCGDIERQTALNAHAHASMLVLYFTTTMLAFGEPTL